jgi:outer membrane protein assembly factor BamD (BamD/ComL family)
MKLRSQISCSLLSSTKLFFLVFIVVFSAQGAETYHLKEGKDWQKLSKASDGGYVIAVWNIKQLISKGKDKEAARALEELKAEFPALVGDDLDALIEAELLFAKDKFVKASLKYAEFLDSFPDSKFFESAMERQFLIADAFIKGQKRQVLFILNLHAYEEADRIMHDIADRSGDAPIAKRSLITLAKGYQERKNYIEAYDVWSEISSRWPTGDLGRDALLQMAQSLHAAYRGPKYDSSSLISARTYYVKFKDRYPLQVNGYDINEKIRLIDEQFAYKELEVAKYYTRAELPVAANLYYQYTAEKWPETTAAKMAREALAQIRSGEPVEAVKKPLERGVFDAACGILDSWYGLSMLAF